MTAAASNTSQSAVNVVVVGVDGSLEAAEAAQYAAYAADERGVDLLLVHAFALPSGSGPGATPLRAATADAAQRVADDTLTQVRVPPGLEVRTRVEVGAPGAFLLQLSQGAALVVLGQHVFDIADQLVVGTVAGPLAAAARCPVVVVPRGWSRVRRRPRTVAVALDGTGNAREVINFAFVEAERHQSRLVALHVVADEAAAAQAAAMRDISEILAGARASHPDVSVSVRLLTGGVAGALLVASEEVRLLVVGRPHPGLAWSRWRGSVAHAVLATARCPLAVLG